MAAIACEYAVMEEDRFMRRQLPLGIRLRSTATFDNFIQGRNEEALVCLKQAAVREEGQSLYLWGGSGCGKSHLLQAVSHVMDGKGGNSAYIPLAQSAELEPGILQGLEIMRLVCIDDVDRIAGQEVWETALFHLYNRLRENNALMVLSARMSPGTIPIELPDLKSRLSWGMVLHLMQPEDEDRILILQQWAKERGMEMPGEVARYLLSRMSRDLHALSAMLDRLDYVSQVTQRRLTIPFVKQMFVTEDK